jgi:hypothetical protein
MVLDVSGAILHSKSHSKRATETESLKRGCDWASAYGTNPLQNDRMSMTTCPLPE